MSYPKKDKSKLMPLMLQTALYSTGMFFLFIPLVFGTLWTMFNLSVASRYVMEVSIAIGLISGNIIANNKNGDKEGGASHGGIVFLISVIMFFTYAVLSYNNNKAIEEEAEEERREKESEEVEKKDKKKATLDDKCFVYGYRSTKSIAERLKGKSVRKHTVPDVCKGRESTRRGSRLYTNGNVNLNL